MTPRLAALVRKAADPLRQAAAPGRGCLPLPPPADPRRRLRRAAESDPRRPPPALRSLAGAARDRARRAGRDPRLPPRAGLPLPRRARDAPDDGAGRRGEAPPDRRRPSRAASRRTTALPSSLLERAAALVPPAELDLALEVRPHRRPVLGEARPAKRSGARIPSPSAPRRRAIAWPSCAGGSRRASSASIVEPEGAAARGWPRSSSRRCPYSRPRATTWRCTPPTDALRDCGAASRADGRGDWRRPSGLPPTLGRLAACRRSLEGPRRLLASSARHPCRSCWRGLTSTSSEQGATTGSACFGLARWRCSVASTRRARSSPRPERSWPSAAGTRARDDHRPNRPPTSSSWPAIPPPPPSSGPKGVRLLEELGNGATSPPQTARVCAGALRARPARRSRRLGRPRGGARRERRRGDADALAAGKGKGARAPRRACRGGTPRARGSRDRREDATYSTGKATRTPTSPRCSCSAARPSEAAAALEQALERYERKGNLVMARADARPAGGFSCRAIVHLWPMVPGQGGPCRERLVSPTSLCPAQLIREGGQRQTRVAAAEIARQGDSKASRSGLTPP